MKSALLALLATVLVQTAPPAQIPFELDHDEVIVSVFVNGRGPLTMLLDTGTDPSAVDLATARELGLKLGSKGFEATGGGTNANRVFETKFAELRVGDVVAKDVEAGAVDLSAISARFGRPVHGVLGYSFLKNRVVQIDYPGRVVRLLAESPPRRPAPGVTVLAFDLVEGGPVVRDTAVNGRAIRTVVDTGSSGYFALLPKGTARLGLEAVARAGAADSSAGYNGNFASTSAEVDSLRVGDIVVERPTVRFFPLGTGHDEHPYEGNLGNRFLKDYVLTIDYKRRLLWLKRG